MNFESKYLILYEENITYSLDDTYNKIVSFHTNQYTTLYFPPYISSIDIHDIIYDNTTVISFLPITAFRNLQILNVQLFLLGYCTPSNLIEQTNPNIYCVEPSIEMDDILPDNVTELIIKYFGENYIYDYIYQSMFTMIIKMFHLSMLYPNSITYQYQFQVLRRLYDPPAPIYSTLLSHNISTYHVILDKDGDNYKLKKYQHFPCGVWPTTYIINTISQTPHCSSPGHIVDYDLIPIVMLFFHEVVLSMEGTIDAVKCVNNNGGINNSPIQIYPIQLDDFKDNDTKLIEYLEELYQSIKYHVVILNTYYQDYSFLYRHFQYHEVFFLSLSPSNNDTYYQNVGYMHMDVDSLLQKSKFEHLFNNPYIVGDLSDFSSTECEKFLLYYENTNKLSYSFEIFNTSDKSVEEITKQVTDNMNDHDIIICTFDSPFTKLFLKELTEKYNRNGIIKYHVFITSLSQYSSNELDYTGHFFYGIFFNFANDSPYDISDYDSFDLQYLNFFDKDTMYSENYMISFFSVFYILKAMSLSGIPDRISYLIKTMTTTHVYSHIGPFIFAPDHYFSVLVHLIYYTSHYEYKEVLSSNGLITNFNTLARYRNYYCNFDVSISYQTIVLFANYPKFSFLYDMLLVFVSYYNIFHVQESNVTMNYWSVSPIQAPYDKEQVTATLTRLETENEIVFMIVTPEYKFLYFIFKLVLMKVYLLII